MTIDRNETTGILHAHRQLNAARSAGEPLTVAQQNLMRDCEIALGVVWSRKEIKAKARQRCIEVLGLGGAARRQA